MAPAPVAVTPAPTREGGNTLRQKAMLALAFLVAPLVALRAMLVNVWAPRSFRADRAAFAWNPQGLLALLVGLSVAVLIPIVGAKLLAAFLPSYWESGAAIVESFLNATIDGEDGIGTTIVRTIAILIAIIVALAPVGLVVLVFAMRMHGRGKTS